MDELAKEDWQWLALAAQQRWSRSDPKPGEPAASKAYLAQQARIMAYVLSRAYPKQD